MYNEKNIEDGLLKQREQDFLALINSIKEVYLGLYCSLDDLFFSGQKLDVSAVEQVVKQIVQNIDDNQEFYESLILAFIYFLYAECNADDRVFGSILKLANTVYKENEADEFDKTTFGIMVADASQRKRLLPFERVAVKNVIKETEKLDKLYSELQNLTDAYSKIKKALEKFLDYAGISCLKDEEQYQTVMNKLRTVKVDAMYLMEMR